MSTTTTTIRKAVDVAGCALDDMLSDGLSLSEALRELSTAPGHGSDGDYTESERQLLARAAELAERLPR